MSLTLNEYIRQSHQIPNKQILESLGADEGLVRYLMETPRNTNFNVVESIMSSGGGGDAEVWLVGNTGVEAEGMMVFELSNVGDVDHITELLNNAENYKVYLNDEELPYFIVQTQPYFEVKAWLDADTEDNATKIVAVYDSNGREYSQVIYANTTIAPTSVEVSVKIKSGSSINADCNHPELGRLIYCGSASNKVILDSGTGTYDEGLQEGYRDVGYWYEAMGEPPTYSIIGVFDGTVVTAEQNGASTDATLTFGSYLTLDFTPDPETGDGRITASPLVGASHYAIYYCKDCSDGIHNDLGTLYYCGGLQNGNIIDTEAGTHDAGAIETDAEVWRSAISAISYSSGHMYLVSNGTTIKAETLGHIAAEFGNTTLSWKEDAETGESVVEITNAPSHYAIYFENNNIEETQ